MFFNATCDKSRGRIKRVPTCLRCLIVSESVGMTVVKSHTHKYIGTCKRTNPYKKKKIELVSQLIVAGLG